MHWALVAAFGIFNHGMWDLVPLTRDQTSFSVLGAQSLSHWTTREVPLLPFLNWETPKGLQSWHFILYDPTTHVHSVLLRDHQSHQQKCAPVLKLKKILPTENFSICGQKPAKGLLDILQMLRRNTTFIMWLVVIYKHAAAAAAAAKSLQSYPTLCDPIDGSPPGSLSLGFSRQEPWSGLPFPSPVHASEKWKWSRSVMSDSQQSDMGCSLPGPSVHGIF